MYPAAIWNIPSDADTIYLTFDDGPIAGITPAILDLLSMYDAKATFFCIGENIERNPSIFEQIKSANHSIGNHTYNHCNGWMTGLNEYIQNIAKCQELTQTKIFRPPYGKMKPNQYRSIIKNHRIVMWDVLSYDFDPQVNASTCFKNVIKKTKNGSVIVFHDSIKASENVLEVLPQILAYYKARGTKFAAINGK